MHRPRRNRKHAIIRELVAETDLKLTDLIYPLFLVQGSGKYLAIKSMPSIFRYSLDKLLECVNECLNLGIKSFCLFPCIEESQKDKYASYSYSKANFYLKAIRVLKAHFSDIIIMTDVALDPYNSDGHDGIYEDGKIVNDKSLDILAKMALTQAEAGADILGPSDMMDGRIGYIRKRLDEAGFYETSLMAYTAKYASAFYTPFRDALDSAPKAGDKKTYQMDYRNANEALLEARLDTDEFADFLMVKPALGYLDVIHRLKQTSLLPIVAYNVSGEYAMIKSAVQNGWLDEKAIILETLYAIKRAGAKIILTYFAKSFAQMKI